MKACLPSVFTLLRIWSLTAFDTRHGIDYSVQVNLMPFLASYFDSKSGVQKLSNFIPVATYPTSVDKALYENGTRFSCAVDDVIVLSTC